MIKVTLPDNSVKEFNEGITIIDIAKRIGEGLAKATCGAIINDSDDIVDLRQPLYEDVNLKIVTNKDEKALDVLRHTAAHIMAQAVNRLFEGTKYAIGPTISDGFYYDFDTENPFKEEDLFKIEEEMKNIIAEDLEITREEMSVSDAMIFFKKRDDKYKVEIIEDLVKNADVTAVTIYKQGDFIDLCRGPHLQKTSALKNDAFKLMKVSGSYWRGDSNRDNLQRIYGTAFFSKKELNKYLNRLKEAEKRDHRKLGKELDLFSFQNECPGMPFWHPNGALIFDLISRYIMNECYKRGYGQIFTPTILDENLWHKSGHWDHFKENMYFTNVDNQSYALKPMNCPGNLLVYKTNLHSYKELPLKFAELGRVHRNELSGVLHGLFRVRMFTQDDAHIFCTEAQLQDEITKLIEFTIDVYKTFGFDKYDIYVATRPKDSMGSDDLWEFATNSLTQALDNQGFSYGIKKGEGAFYGPKIEFNIKDCLERDWQCGTIQVDFSMPKRFDIKYKGNQGEDNVPVMIHRAILGSLERFIGILIEHYEGKFPIWLSPIQVELIPVSDAFCEYTDKVYEQLKNEGLRVSKNYKQDTLKYKIRQAQMSKIPYMVIIGEKEQNSNSVNVRVRDKGELGQLPTEEFIKKIKEEIAELK